MKPATVHCLILGCFYLAFCCGYTSCKFLKSEHHPHIWKNLILVHHWPVTVCKMNENDCKEPPQYWTIHGLWPEKVEECNRTWHFNVNEIKDLLPDMRQYWPDILHSSLNRTQFWKHEWEKHGTCAATVESLNSQKKYFGKTLDLYQKLDLNSCVEYHTLEPAPTHWWLNAVFPVEILQGLVLAPKLFNIFIEEPQPLQLCFSPKEAPSPGKLHGKIDRNTCLLKVGIKPSSSYYQMTAIKEALTSVYGVTPKVQCLPPEQGEEVQTIGQIEFCFTKELELRNCTHAEAESYILQNDWSSGPEELSICNDTLTYYPSQV
uniref:Ribonuclease T2 n=1 Tax=Pelodiscus sinensis TaxID=13735 RepID=K7F537_PELSI